METPIQTPEAPAPQAPVMPDPQSLSSDERLIAVNQLRARVARGEDVSNEQLAYAIELLRADRATSSTRKKSTKKEAPAAPKFKLEDMFK